MGRWVVVNDNIRDKKERGEIEEEPESGEKERKEKEELKMQRRDRETSRERYRKKEKGRIEEEIRGESGLLWFMPAF